MPIPSVNPDRSLYTNENPLYKELNTCLYLNLIASDKHADLKYSQTFERFHEHQPRADYLKKLRIQKYPYNPVQNSLVNSHLLRPFQTIAHQLWRYNNYGTLSPSTACALVIFSLFEEKNFDTLLKDVKTPYQKAAEQLLDKLKDELKSKRFSWKNKVDVPMLTNDIVHQEGFREFNNVSHIESDVFDAGLFYAFANQLVNYPEHEAMSDYSRRFTELHSELFSPKPWTGHFQKQFTQSLKIYMDCIDAYVRKLANDETARILGIWDDFLLHHVICSIVHPNNIDHLETTSMPCLLAGVYLNDSCFDPNETCDYETYTPYCDYRYSYNLPHSKVSKVQQLDPSELKGGAGDEYRNWIERYDQISRTKNGIPKYGLMLGKTSIVDLTLKAPPLRGGLKDVSDKTRTHIAPDVISNIVVQRRHQLEAKIQLNVRSRDSLFSDYERFMRGGVDFHKQQQELYSSIR